MINEENTASSLAKRLKEIFEFEKAEGVIEGMGTGILGREMLT